MMNFPIFRTFMVLGLVMMIACQPGRVVKTEVKAPPDSAMYYQQSDISDPFLDTIFQEPDQTIALNQIIYPVTEAEVTSRFKEAEGFRVQVFAGADSVRALSIRKSISDQSVDSVHLFLEKGLYKIQVGDYLYRYLADNVKTKMRQDGYPGAWVVQRTILVPADTTARDSITVNKSPDSSAAQINGTYKIQLVATGDQERAREIVQDVSMLTTRRVYFEASGNLFKVFVGSFEEESQARSELEKLRRSGYPDAWLVY